MVLDGGLNIAEVSCDLNLTETSLRNWVHKVKAERTQVPEAMACLENGFAAATVFFDSPKPFCKKI